MKPKPLIQKLIPTLYEDDRFVIVDKPAGIDVGGLPEKGVSGLLELLLAMRNRTDQSVASGKGDRPRSDSLPALHVINRLSRYESGLLILGKDADSAAFVRNGLKAQRVEHEFVAVVIGAMNERRIVLESGGEASRGRSRGKVRLGRSNPAKPVRTTEATLTSLSPLMPTTLTRIAQSKRRVLIRCRTSAANTHVLRAQLRSAKLRLLGDNVNDRSPRRQHNESTCLHLAKVTFHHPMLRTRISVASPSPTTFEAAVDGGVDIDRPCRAGLVRRLACMADTGTNCFRLLTGEREDFPGINVEKYADVLIIQLLDERADQRELLTRVTQWYRDALKVWAVYVKPFVRERTRPTGDVADRISAPKPFWGDPVEPEIEVRERGLRFAIRPYDGFNVGLFLDHRDNRSRIREMAGGADVLNLFAYTCGFSVAAAIGGAKSTVSVDLSPKHLEWGRTNFALNHVDLAEHSFIRSDAFDYLKRAKRQEKFFDLIVIDPPSFAHGNSQGGDFSIMTDLPRLVSAAIGQLRPGGAMMISTNYRRLSLVGLKERALQGAGARRAKIISTPPLPPDFSVDRDHAKTVFLRG